ATVAADYFGAGASWVTNPGEHVHEAELLTLDATKAEIELGWENLLPFRDSVEWTIDWQKAVAKGESAAQVTRDQIRSFEARRL
ncbi:MAG: hypothetical protein Q8M65_03575, partial [Rhodoglobus sp.]|nr:hypothetical protein [Rhodoglobus sp.]